MNPRTSSLPLFAMIFLASSPTFGAQATTAPRPRPSAAIPASIPAEAAATAGAASTSVPEIRIGTYDSRMVALAFAHSEQHSKRVEALRAATVGAEGTRPAIPPACAKLKMHEAQELLHMQVFGQAPIHDIVDEIRDIVADEARKAQVLLVVRDIDIAHESKSIRRVDLTAALLSRLGAKAETLRVAEELKQHPPLPLTSFPIDCGDGHDAPARDASKGKEDGGECDAETEAAAKAEASRWVGFLDEGRYAESWKESSAHFRAVVPEARWIADMRSLRGPPGKLLSRTLRSARVHASLPDAPPGCYVILDFESAFESKSGAKERITLVYEADGGWRLDGYFLR